MKLITATLVATFITSTIWAYGLTGQWRGQGPLAINGVVQDGLCQMELDIEHTSETFLVARSYFKCPGMNFVNKPQKPMQIKDGKLYSGDKVMGEISEDTMKSFTLFPDGREQNYFIHKNADGSLQYWDRVDWTTAYSTAVSGTLFMF